MFAFEQKIWIVLTIRSLYFITISANKKWKNRQYFSKEKKCFQFCDKKWNLLIQKFRKFFDVYFQVYHYDLDFGKFWLLLLDIFNLSYFNSHELEYFTIGLWHLHAILDEDITFIPPLMINNFMRHKNQLIFHLL